MLNCFPGCEYSAVLVGSFSLARHAFRNRGTRERSCSVIESYPT